MEIGMMDGSKMTRKLEKVFSRCSMEIAMKVNLRMTNSMAKGDLFMKIRQYSLANSAMTLYLERVQLYLEMGSSTMENLSMECSQ
jgi:hypothetical protein